MAVPDGVKLAFAAGGIFFSFAYFAVLQENVYKTDYPTGEAGKTERFGFTMFALFIERGVNAALALIGVMVFGGSGIKIPHYQIFQSGVSQMLAMAASNEALRHVSFATQVLGKSAKMVPVMLGGVYFGGKVYSMFEYVQVFIITGGVIVFNFGGKSKKGGDDSTMGMALICASLVLDAVTGGKQDQVKKVCQEQNLDVPKAKPTMFESMLYTNLSGFATALVLAIVMGQLQGGIAFCQAHPEVMNSILIYSASSGVGQVFIYYTITQFTPLVLTTVTTTRKIFSTLYSVFRGGKGLGPMQWVGCAMVFVGLLGDVYHKYSHSKPKDEKKTK